MPFSRPHSSVVYAVVTIAVILTSAACTKELSRDATARRLTREGVAKENAGDIEGALMSYSSATLRAEHPPREAWLRYTRLIHDRGEWALAKASAGTCVEHFPDSAYAHELLGRSIVGAHGDSTVAIRELSRAIELDGSRSYLHLIVGNLHESHGRYPEARTAYEHAAGARPNSLGANVAMIRMLLDPRGGAPIDSKVGPAIAAAEQLTGTEADRAELARLKAMFERLSTAR